MKYLIDTDVIAGYLKGIPQDIKFLQAIARDGLAISIISYGELYEGIYYGRNTQRDEKSFQGFLRGVDILPLNRTIMKRFARIRGHLRKTGNIIGDPDILIGATALFHGLTVVTHNNRHFQRIPNLLLYTSLQQGH